MTIHENDQTCSNQCDEVEVEVEVEVEIENDGHRHHDAAPPSEQKTKKVLQVQDGAPV